MDIAKEVVQKNYEMQRERERHKKFIRINQYYKYSQKDFFVKYLDEFENICVDITKNLSRPGEVYVCGWCVLLVTSQYSETSIE